MALGFCEFGSGGRKKAQVPGDDFVPGFAWPIGTGESEVQDIAFCGQRAGEKVGLGLGQERGDDLQFDLRVGESDAGVADSNEKIITGAFVGLATQDKLTLRVLCLAEVFGDAVKRRSGAITWPHAYDGEVGGGAYGGGSEGEQDGQENAHGEG